MSSICLDLVPCTLGTQSIGMPASKAVTGWDPRAFYRHIRPAAFPGGPDIKEPWELSRCHHFVRLGQAYRLNGDEKYALELVAQSESWMASNLWPNGVNWTSSMDAAIRAANWLSGASLCVNSAALSDEFLQRLSLNLWIHGRHIRRHLEGSRDDPYTGNHYLANLAGLIYLGLCCPFLRDAPEWLEFAVGEFYRQVLQQTYQMAQTTRARSTTTGSCLKWRCT